MKTRFHETRSNSRKEDYTGLGSSTFLLRLRSPPSMKLELLYE